MHCNIRDILVSGSILSECKVTTKFLSILVCVHTQIYQASTPCATLLPIVHLLFFPQLRKCCTLDSCIMSAKVQLGSEYNIMVPFRPAERGLTFPNMGCCTACCSEEHVKGIPWTCDTIRKGLSFKVYVNGFFWWNIWQTCLKICLFFLDFL